MQRMAFKAHYSTDDSKMVPITAVKEGKVVKINGGKASSVAVKTDIKTQQAIEITDGLKEGDAVAQAYDATLLEQNKLRSKTVDWSPDKK